MDIFNILVTFLFIAVPALSNPVCLENRAAPTKTTVTRFAYAKPSGVDALPQYFSQETKAYFYTSLSGFGLLPSQTYAAYPTCTGADWQRFKCYVESHNKAHPQSLYKLLFLARHGQGKHNVASTCAQLLSPSILDAELTNPTGTTQALDAQSYWAKATASPSYVWSPEKVYVSPLQRALLTGYITFNGQKIVNLMDELGETKDLAPFNRRHNTGWIKSNIINNPAYNSSAFAGVDQLDFCDTEWLRYAHMCQKETSAGQVTRVTNFLDYVFSQNPDKNFIYITSHGGTSSAILSALNVTNNFGGSTGQIYPVLVQYSSTGTVTITKPTVPPTASATCSYNYGGSCATTVLASFQATDTSCP